MGCSLQPLLLKRYNAHINVEICASIKSIKYLYKYIFKGHDAASLIFTPTSGNQNYLNYDEATHHVEARYVGSPEAAWRIAKNPIQFKSHTVIRLAVHCENLQQVVFEEGNEDIALDNAASNYTTLTAFFKLNEDAWRDPLDPQNPMDLRNMSYVDIPKHFVFDKNNGWTKRERHGDEFGRMYFVSPADTERFHLRLLLLHRKGPTSFESIRTVNGTIHPTFKSAAMALGLIADNKEWDNTMNEACSLYGPGFLRQLFTTILVFCNPSDPKQLWMNHLASMREDYERRGIPPEAANYLCYQAVNRLIDGRLKLENIIEQPNPIDMSAHPITQQDEDTLQMTKEVASAMYDSLNEEQKNIADAVLNSMDEPSTNSRCFFVDGPGGSGKTYLYETLYRLFTTRGKNVTNIAWSGIAAQLLPLGKTVHSVFKLPVPIDKDKYLSYIKPGTPTADLLLNTDIFIWDEAPMSPKFALHGVDELLRDLTGSDIPFGGKIILFGGDFRQIPPIVKEKKISAVVEASIKRSYLWPLMRKFQLHTNMRAVGESNDFLEFLMKIGNGTAPLSDEGDVKIPDSMLSDGDLLSEIFGDILSLVPELLAKRAILCPKNVQCAKINNEILDLLPGQASTYFSVDDAMYEPGDPTYPTEFINSLTPSGLPPHELILKRGAIVMLLRNLDVRKGLCNGTRLIVEKMNTHTIECKKVGSNEIVIIPRIDSVPCETDLPFRLKRHQFPIKLCFAMTIHKSQGQSFDKIGVNLETPLFAHGHLYVALSRCRTEAGLKVFIPDGTNLTRNVVYGELLQ